MYSNVGGKIDEVLSGAQVRGPAVDSKNDSTGSNTREHPQDLRWKEPNNGPRSSAV